MSGLGGWATATFKTIPRILLSTANEASGEAREMYELSIVPFSVTYGIEVGLVSFALTRALVSSYVCPLSGSFLPGLPSSAVTFTVEAVQVRRHLIASELRWSELLGLIRQLSHCDSRSAPRYVSVQFHCHGLVFDLFEIWSNGTRSATHKTK